MRRTVDVRPDDNPDFVARMSHIQEAGQELQTLVTAEYYPLRIVDGVEGLRNLKGFEQAYITGRNRYIEQYTGRDKRTLATRRTKYWAIAGRTLSYKRGASSELVHLARNDPYLFNKLGRHPEMLYTGFASAAKLAQLEGKIPGNEGHGTYSYTSYRAATNTLWENIAGQSINHENPRWMVVETTGPAAYVDDNGRIKGPDRGFGALLEMAEHFREQTEVIAIKRKRRKGVYKKGMAFRQEVIDAKPEDMPKLMDKYQTLVVDDGQVVDISKWSHQELLALRQELIDSQAPPAGVRRSNLETDKLMKHMGVTDEDEFWIKLLIDELGFSPAATHVVDNPFTARRSFSLHHRLLNDIDPIKKKIDQINAWKRASVVLAG